VGIGEPGGQDSGEREGGLKGKSASVLPCVKYEMDD
jgi:hypothetical protein